MFMAAFLAGFLSLLLLLLAKDFEYTVASHLHQNDVEALNAMAHALRMQNQGFSQTSCSSASNSRTSTKLQCDCTFKNLTLCRVTKIDFTGQQLSGVIPPEVGNLHFLQVLNLSKNEIHGIIPNSIRRLKKLSNLTLTKNNLEGPIPSVIGEMKSLMYIDLSGNWFNESIPPTLASLPSLKYLYLHNNLLTGGIPPEFGNITSLVQLDLSDNQLSGVLPEELGNLTNLDHLWLINNEFSGELPKSFAKLTNMVNLFIFGNNFSGKIPDYIAAWKNLTTLGLIGNNFEGPFPDALSSLDLIELHVGDLTGNNEGRGFSFPNISGMKSLEWLTLRNCSMTGPIPEYLGQMTNLYYLDLSFNNLTGEIPDFVGHQNILQLYLKENKLSGSIPSWLGDSTNKYVDISENNFTSAPVQLGGISSYVNSFACCSTVAANLTMPWQRSDYHCHSDKSLNDHLYINCGGEETMLNGITYQADTQPDGDSAFYLSNDKSWGSSRLGIFIAIDRDQYIMEKSCGIASSGAPLYKTARVAPISLKYFGFCMKDGNYRVKLHFAEIVYEENVDPRSKGKRLFDVVIQDKKVLENFNIREAAKGVNNSVTMEFIATVKNNRLEIHLYWTGKGSIRPPFEYYGPLISAISVSPVPKKSSRRPSAISIAALVGSALLVPLLILLSIRKVGRGAGKEPYANELKGLELPGGSFNFRQIKSATQNFNPVNKIGEGGFGPVFKGLLPNGTAIAVKQLSSKSKQGTREFVNELGTIFALQHPHLVKLLGCCTEDNQLLLVYEYMENNSLAHVLFGPQELRLRLNWPTRFNICLGLAKGLSFLHEESKLKIVHRDIKPTNVLLDKDLNAKISDFGLAKLYETEKTHVITRIAGTTGYMAPEYAMRGYLTNKADVYSFGVVVLEIVSGRSGTSYRPNDESVYLLDLAYVLQQKGELLSLVDPALGYDYSVKQATTILDLAMLCTNPSPTLRPTMSEVVKVLEGKCKIKSPSIDTAYSADDFAMAKTLSGLFPRIQSGSSSTGKTSNPVSYDVISRGEEYGISEECPSEMFDKTTSFNKVVPLPQFED